MCALRMHEFWQVLCGEYDNNKVLNLVKSLFHYNDVSVQVAAVRVNLFDAKSLMADKEAHYITRFSAIQEARIVVFMGKHDESLVDLILENLLEDPAWLIRKAALDKLFYIQEEPIWKKTLRIIGSIKHPKYVTVLNLIELKRIHQRFIAERIPPTLGIIGNDGLKIREMIEIKIRSLHNRIEKKFGSENIYQEGLK